MKFDRREFITVLSMSAGYLAFSNPLLACSGNAISTDPFQSIKLGNSGLKTSLLGMGTGWVGGNRSSTLTRMDLTKSMGILRHAYDSGIRMFDCADSYGTHPLMADALKGMERDFLNQI